MSDDDEPTAAGLRGSDRNLSKRGIAALDRASWPGSDDGMRSGLKIFQAADSRLIGRADRERVDRLIFK